MNTKSNRPTGLLARMAAYRIARCRVCGMVMAPDVLPRHMRAAHRFARVRDMTGLAY